MTGHPGAARERGYALLITLWALVLVSLLVLRLTESGSAEARLAGNLRRGAVAEAEADGAFNEAAFRLATSKDALPGAGAFALATPHGHADIRFRSEAGKVDLDNSSPPIVAALIEAVGANETEANAVAENIVAWHTAIPAAQLPALYAPYRAAGLRYGPSGAEFRSVDELRLVLGMTPSLFTALAPHLTVYGTGDPDLAIADPVVRQAAAAIGETAAATNSGAAGSDPGDVFSIRVDARVAGSRFVRDGVVQLEPGDDGAPWRVLTWTNPDATGA